MALVTLRFQYLQSGVPSDAELQNLMGFAAESVSGPIFGDVRDVVVDDTISDAVAVATETWLSLGWSLIATDPGNTIAEALAALISGSPKLRESGGTDLTMGAVADGQYLRRVGSTVVGGTPAGGGGSYDPRDLIAFDHFLLGNVDLDEVGSLGWKKLTGGTGTDLSAEPEAGHPGVISLGAGTAAGSRTTIYLGDNGSLESLSLGTTQPDISFEFLVKFTGSIDAADLERATLGWGNEWDASAGAEHSDGIYIEFDPSSDAHFRLRTATATVKSTTDGTTTIVIDTWYRVGVRMTYPGDVPTAQLVVNGVDEGSPLTTNIPTDSLGFGARIDAGTNGVESRVNIDYVMLTQVSDKED